MLDYLHVPDSNFQHVAVVAVFVSQDSKSSYQSGNVRVCLCNVLCRKRGFVFDDNFQSVQCHIGIVQALIMDIMGVFWPSQSENM